MILLAWKLADELLECLCSLTAQKNAPAFEVIVVLNGSSAEVRAAVAAVHGIRIVDLPANVGFGAGCNSGAAVARGELLVFLNDDAVVESGWLRALVDSLDETTGSVASLLLNPDGTVQNAGSVVAASGWTRGIGEGMTVEQADEAGLLTRRAVDYGAGAALLVRADAFRELDGFDPLFDPAYFEDVDLQFRLRAAGWDVVIEPSARATHRLNGSTADAGEFRAWASQRGHAAFCDRWAGVLTRAEARGPDPLATIDIPRERRLALGSAVGCLEPLSDRDVFDRAMATANAYAAYLLGRLRDDELAAARVQETIASLEHFMAELGVSHEAERERANRAEETIGALQHRLHDLDHRGPLGLVRWRAGVWVGRRRSRRAELELTPPE